MKQIFKTVIAGAAGAILAVVALFGGTALAGTGVGAVFNLGQVNTVNAQSELTGSLNGVLLKVTNSNAGASSTALRLTVPTSRPPFVTNGTGKVVNLQADKVDGQSANEIARVAGQASQSTGWLEDDRTVLQTVTISAPQDGFVFLSGQANPAFFDGCGYCAVHLRFHDVEANTDTPTNGTVISKTGVEQFGALALSLMVPVTAGTHTFQLIGSWYDVGGSGTAPTTWYDPAASALFFRFNGDGTSFASKPGKSPVQRGPAGSATQR
jgi:hypothetical protein